MSDKDRSLFLECLGLLAWLTYVNDTQEREAQRTMEAIKSRLQAAQNSSN